MSGLDDTTKSRLGAGLYRLKDSKGQTTEYERFRIQNKDVRYIEIERDRWGELFVRLELLHLDAKSTWPEDVQTHPNCTSHQSFASTPSSMSELSSEYKALEQSIADVCKQALSVESFEGFQCQEIIDKYDDGTVSAIFTSTVPFN